MARIYNCEDDDNDVSWTSRADDENDDDDHHDHNNDHHYTRVAAHVSVNQILTALINRQPNQQLLTIHNTKIRHVILVGQVVCQEPIKKKNGRKIILQVDDYSGDKPLQVSYYIQGSLKKQNVAAAPNTNIFQLLQPSHPVLRIYPAEWRNQRRMTTIRDISSIKQNDHVHIIGVINFNYHHHHHQPTHVYAYNIRIITDYSELTMHNLEIMRDLLYYSKKAAAAAAAEPATTSTQE